jgi:branched-chain amino acid transport system substrate-binding protein
MRTRPIVSMPLLRGLCAVVVAWSLTACTERKAAGAAERTGSASDSVIIAAAWPWASYPDMLYGKGLDLAVEEANAAGGLRGRPFALRRVDDQQSVDNGRLVAERLVTAGGIAAVIGHMQSYITVPAAAVYDAAGIVLVAPSSTDGSLTDRGYRRVFRSIFTDHDAGTQMADLAAESGVKRIGIFYIRNEYGRALSNAFETRARALGVDVIGRVSYDAGSSTGAELEQIVRQWNERHVDGVFLAAEAGPAARFAREVKRQGLNIALFGSDALGIPALIAEGGIAVEGLMLPAPFHPGDPRIEVQAFVRQFTARHGTGPDALAALGYDAMRLVTHSIVTAGTTAQDSVAAVLHATRNWRGVTRSMSFDSTGSLAEGPITRVMVRRGAFTFLGSGARVARTERRE